MSVLICLFSN